MDAVSLVRRELNGSVPLIGFSGSPWTLFTYMIEGGSSKTFSRAKKLIYQDPGLAHQLLEKLADTVTEYLNATDKQWRPDRADIRYLGRSFIRLGLQGIFTAIYGTNRLRTDQRKRSQTCSIHPVQQGMQHPTGSPGRLGL